MKRRRLLGKTLEILLNFMMLLFSFACIFPLIWMTYSSLKTQKDFSLNIISLPLAPQFNNYIEAIRTGKMHIFFLNSMFIGIISVVFIIAIGFITAYCLSRFNFRGRNLIYVLFLFGMLVPVHSLLVPVFIQFKWLGLLNKRLTLILPYVAFGLPMAIFLLESFIKTIPIEIEEAACIDGSPIAVTLMKIIMPICRPAMSTVLILTFLHVWNEFPFALILIKSDYLKTLPVGLTNFSGQYSVDYPRLMAALVIATLPVIIVYLLFSKKIIQGMTAGAVKG